MSFAIPSHHLAAMSAASLTPQGNGTPQRNGTGPSSSPASSSHGHGAASSAPKAASVAMSAALSAATQPGTAGSGPSNLVAEFLKSPDDMAKIAALRKKLLKEQASLSAKLKLGAKEQLEATREGLLKLQATRQDVAAIREAFAQVEALYNNTDVDGGSGIASDRRESVVPRDQPGLADPPQLCADDEHAREAGCASGADRGASGYAAARGGTTSWIARTCSADVRSTVAEFFAPLDGLIRAFDEYIMTLAERTMDLVREGRPAVVVKLVKIIEKESREDERAAAIRLAKRANLEGAARFRSVVANARVIKLYRPKFVEAIDRSAAELFDECWSRFGSDGTSLEFLAHLDWIYDDLRFVETENPPEEDNEGLYGLQGAAILFQMVNQQVDVAADSGQASVLAKVVDHAAKAMHSTQATGKLRMPAAGDQMRKDVDDAKTLFLAFKKEEEVQEKFEVADAILGMLTSSPTMVFLPYWSFAKAHGSHLGFLEAVMRARDDLKKDDVNGIMESARRKVKSEGLNDVVPATGGPTVMSRVAQAYGSSFGSGLLANLGAERAAGMAASALASWKSKERD
ncbi:hypothetical protein L1887_58122 [Cichorium endivia]|nr:hypothetical protein L1887_58122 [Cichorium endivia]